MFGIGPTELLILIVIGVLVVGVPIAIIVLIVFLALRHKSSGQSPSYPQLLEENQRLREELAAVKGKNAQATADQ